MAGMRTTRWQVLRSRSPGIHGKSNETHLPTGRTETSQPARQDMQATEYLCRSQGQDCQLSPEQCPLLKPESTPMFVSANAVLLALIISRFSKRATFPFSDKAGDIPVSFPHFLSPSWQLTVSRAKLKFLRFLGSIRRLGYKGSWPEISSEHLNLIRWLS